MTVLKYPQFRILLVPACLFGMLPSHDVMAQAEPAPLDIAQTPLFLRQPEAPLNMLIVGRDHKLFYEAYNDSSDLNEDGIVDVGYKPATVTYYGNFDSNLCYTYSSGVFSPSATTSNKKCSGSWSGDFLNYLTSARIDALRKVLYGGKRTTDTATQTIIERAHVPQDGHSWGKEYESIARDGYDIREYAPLALPADGTRHLFGSVNLGDTNTPTDPLLRVLVNSKFRIWNWASIEGPVLGDQCVTSGNNRTSCEVAATASSTTIVEASYFPTGVTQTFYTRANDPNNTQTPTATLEPGRSYHPTSAATYDLFMAKVAVANKRCGSRTVANIDGSGNPYTNNAPGGSAYPCSSDRYATVMTGSFLNPGPDPMTVYIDGDDAVLLKINGVTCNGYYGGHGEGGGTTYPCTIPVGTSVLTFWHEEVDGGDAWRLRRLVPPTPASTRTDYIVRTEVCKTGFPESHCRSYPRNSLTPTVSKPTGLLHDYGEDNTMMFGLLTGSYRNNTEGGILRKAMSSFANEVTPATGIFTTTASTVQTLDRLRVVGFVGNSYGGSDGKCPGLDRLVAANECYAWGNPLAEMMLESMRYFSGAATATPGFINNVSGLTRNWDSLLSLPEVTWSANTNPYRSRASGGFSVCAKPFQTLISDINPSYDTNILGTATSINSLPLDAVALGGQIWSHEFGGTRRIYIGESGSLNDGAPTAKDVTSFGNIRGLSPEEPTKKGGYYAASLALWGLTNDVNPAVSVQNIKTFSVALASPLPKIVLPVRDQVVTLIPFGKTVSGTFGGSAFKPTNTIVDFYVEAIGNFPGAPTSTANNGKGFARFRINYEDVEQGNDHDMDAIILYDLRVVTNASTGLDELSVNLTSEYAAGSANQNLGYIISGTTADGIYLEVRDSDSAQNTSAYLLNTPAGVSAGGCSIASPPAACNDGLTLNSSRTFVPGSVAAASLLKDPLWFAAKYGGFDDSGASPNGLPDAGEWDRKGPTGNTPDGNPDNYFLVTNALKLKDQLKEAFQQILEVSRPQGRLATNSTRINGRTLLFQAEYDSRDWTGDVRAYRFDEATLAPSAEVWNAASKLSSTTARKIFTFNPESGTTGQGVTFELANLSNAQKLYLNSNAALQAEVLAYLRGDQSKEKSRGGPYRTRSKLIGDIANSGPQVMSRESYGYEQLPSERTSYSAYLATKEGRGDFVFVGANDGMLHAFDGSSGANGGREVFAFIPNATFPNLKKLLDPAYEHNYYVDGTPTIGDAKIGGGWKTVLVGSLGAGGRSVYALDITAPNSFTASKVLWEFTDPDLGFGIGQAKIVRLVDGRFAAIFGNGYNSTNNKAMLFVVNLETGALIRKIDTNVGSSLDTNGLGSPTAIDASGLAKAQASRSSPVVPFAQSTPPLSFDLRADTVYAGDLYGNVWRFDISPSSPASWSFVRLFNAVDSGGNRQKVTAAPQAAAHPLGGVLVLFGTGRYFVKGDSETSTGDPVNSFYGIWDPGSLNLTTGASPITRSLLQQRTIGTNTTVSGLGTVRTVSGDAFVWGQKFGYVLDFAQPNALLGERVLAQPLVRFGLVFFNTFAPNVNLTDNCEPGGRGFLMSLSAFGGLPAITLPSGAACPGCAGIERSSDSPPGEPTLLTGDGVLVDVPPNFSDSNGVTPKSRLIGRPYGQLSWRQLK